MYIKPNDRDILEAEIFISTMDDRPGENGPRTMAMCYIGWLALQKFKTEKRISAYVKKQCDEKFGGAGWQCVVGMKLTRLNPCLLLYLGRTFGSFVSVDAAGFANFRIGKTVFLLFRTYDSNELERMEKRDLAVKNC
jgi:hypothetical protein